MNRNAAIDILQLFNAKADWLLSLSYWVKNRGSGSILDWDRSQGWDSIFIGADDESLHTLILTARLFIQDNDRISLRNLRKTYAGLRISSDLGNAVNEACADLNIYLDSESNLAIEENRQLTNKDILEIFLYGGYAHTNPSKRRIFEQIEATPSFPLFQTIFASVLVRLARAVDSIRVTNEKALKELVR